MENKHTDLPWDSVENPDCENAQYDRFLVRCKTDYPGVRGTVAMCGYKPNAEFIVMACNGHYELLKLCKDSYEALRDIINSADNNHPYSARELEDNFNDTANNLYDEIRKHEPDFE